jgi:two-component system cell cycle sensor histidine kinase/response regulator CckA
MSIILIVEDDPVSAKLLESLIENSGFFCEVFHAKNGVDALAQLQALDYQVDLVITDILMPEMDGMELAFALYRRNLLDRIILIGVSSLSPNDLIAIQNSSADVSWFTAWLAKPFTLTTVTTLLVDHLPME